MFQSEFDYFTILDAYNKGKKALKEHDYITLFKIIKKEPRIFDIHLGGLNSFVKEAVTNENNQLLLDFFKSGAINSSPSIAETLLHCFKQDYKIDPDNTVKEYIIENINKELFIEVTLRLKAYLLSTNHLSMHESAQKSLEYLKNGVEKRNLEKSLSSKKDREKNKITKL